MNDSVWEVSDCGREVFDYGREVGDFGGELDNNLSLLAAGMRLWDDFLKSWRIKDAEIGTPSDLVQVIVRG